MRMLGRIAVVGMAGMAASAGAQVVPSPIAPVAPAAPAPRAPLPLSPVALGGTVERAARLGKRLNMRVTVASTAAGPRDRVHSRLTGQMIDFYPAGDHGFHLSAGMRLFNPRGMGAAESAARGLSPSQRRLNIPGMKTTMRQAPALTLGYTDRIDADTSLGVEVGAMKGRAYYSAADVARQTRADRNMIGSPINPVFNLVMARRF